MAGFQQFPDGGGVLSRPLRGVVDERGVVGERGVVDDPAGGSVPIPDTDVAMVSRSVRLPLETYERVRRAADARGLGVTTLMRQWIETGLADLDDSATVSLADVRRALAALARPC